MTKLLAAQEIAREARRVLRRLGVARAALVALDPQRYVVTRNPGAAESSRLRVTAVFVQAFLERGWIASDGPGRFVRTQAGALFLAQGESESGGEKLMQARAITDPDGMARTVRVNMGESPLARLAFRNLVEPLQFQAGEKLRRDFTLAQMTPRMGVDWTAPVVSGRRGPGAGDNISDIALAARQRLSHALAALGPELADLAFDVCCHLMALELAEMRRSWTKRSGRVVLKIALDRLAAHYGMGVTGQSKSRIRKWVMEDGAKSPDVSPPASSLPSSLPGPCDAPPNPV